MPIRAEPGLQSYAARHGGIFTRPVALSLGLSDAVIRARIDQGVWHRVRRGSYAFADHWNTLGPVERHRAHVHAAALRCSPDTVFSHVSGAVLRGWPIWNVPLDLVDITRDAHKAARIEAGIRHHRAELPADQVEQVDGLHVCTKERLMADAARAYGFEEAVVICDAALRSGADRERARDLLRWMDAWPGSRYATSVLRFADGRAESVGESRLRVVLHREGITGFEPQQRLIAPDGRFLGRGDLVDRERGVLLEFDGRGKYGIDGDDPREQLWREKEREDAIREELRLGIVRVRWADLEAPERLARRVHRATERSTGDSSARHARLHVTRPDLSELHAAAPRAAEPDTAAPLRSAGRAA